MKKISIYFLNLLMLGSMTSCFEDEGNYDYDELFQIQVSGLEEKYSCNSLIDSLNLEPQIAQNASASDYDYFWAVYQKNVQGYAPKLDTICYTKDLHMLVTLQPNEYELVFCATEKNTGIPKYVQIGLQVTTAMSEGWYVLKGNEGKTDLDLFTDKGKVEDVIAKSNGKSLQGDPAFLNYTTKYKAYNPDNKRYVNTNTLFALSSEDIAAMRLSNGKIERDFNSIFFSDPAGKRPQSFIISNMGDCYFLNDGKMYSIYGMMMNSGRFGEAKASDHQLSPYCVGHFIGNPILFDETSSSFCSCDGAGFGLIYFKDDKTKISSNNMNVDLLYMGSGANKNLAIVKTKGKDVYRLMQLDPFAAKQKSPWEQGSSYTDLITKSDTLKNDMQILKADKWAPNTTNNIIYFAKENVIYSCNIDGGLVEKEQFTLPAGVEVTFMRNLSFRKPDKMFNKLVVATHDGQNYKSYLFDIQAGNLAGEPVILEGKGKVGAMIYVDNNQSTSIY